MKHRIEETWAWNRSAPMFFRGGRGRGYFRLLPLLGSMLSHSLSEALPLAPGKMLRQLMAVPRGLGCSGVGGALAACPSREPRGDCVGFSAFPLSPCTSSESRSSHEGPGAVRYCSLAIRHAAQH